MSDLPPLPGHPRAPTVRETWVERASPVLGAAQLGAVLYVFLVSITLLGTAFLALGQGFAEGLIRSTRDPLVGLLIGILATSIIQSSSATTSILIGSVAAVGAGGLDAFLRNAIPIVMGANLGTTVTAVLVSMGHIRRKEEFRRAFGCALVHEIYKLSCVVVLFPVELATGFLQRSARSLAGFLWHATAREGVALGFQSPLKVILAPAAEAVAGVFVRPAPGESSDLGAVALLVVALALLFGSLFLMTTIMRRALVGRAVALIDNTVGRAPLIGLLVGFVLTGIVQSSSAVTSILVPLAGAGVLTLEQVFPIELGSCLGTTVTGLLAALAVGPAGLAVALTHVVFNLVGIALVYPVRWVRARPVQAARWLASVAAESKGIAIVYIVGTFYAVPGLLLLLESVF